MDSHTLEMIGVIIVAVITAIIGPTIVEIVKLKLRGKDLKDPIKEEVKQSRIILDELDEIRELLDCDRIWIQMYHNGGHYLLSNKSIQKFSIMYESVRPGVSMVGHIFNNIPISLYSRATDQLLEGGHIYIPDYFDPKIATYGLKTAAESTGTKSSYAVGLFDIETDKCIGSLGIDYLKKKKLKTESLNILNQRAQRVSGYISNFLK